MLRSDSTAQLLRALSALSTVYTSGFESGSLVKRGSNQTAWV